MIEELTYRPKYNYVEKTIRDNLEAELGKELLDLFFLHYLHKYRQNELCKIYKINKDELNWRLKYIMEKIKKNFNLDDFDI